MISYFKAVEYQLKNYNDNKMAIDYLKKKLELTNNRKYKLESNKLDITGVRGGGITTEDNLIKQIDEADKIKRRLEYIQCEVDSMERAFRQLTEEQQLVLREFYIKNNRHALSILIPELNYSKTHIYRMKQTALEELTSKLYGRCVRDKSWEN